MSAAPPNRDPVVAAAAAHVRTVLAAQRTRDAALDLLARSSADTEAEAEAVRTAARAAGDAYSAALREAEAVYLLAVAAARGEP